MIYISVIMPVYNVENYLQRSIKSIINQSFTNWELVIVNDGSTDDSGKICDEFASNDSRIKVIHQKNSGSGSARRKAMSYAIGEYICFVDPDDYLEGDLFCDNIKLIETYKPDVLVNGYYQLTKNIKGEIIYDSHVPRLEGCFKKNDFIEKFREYEQVGSRSLWNKLYNRNFLLENKIEFTNQRVGQDALFNFNVYSSIESIYINSNKYYVYDSLREGSAVKKFNKERFLYEKNIADEYKEMFKKWNMTDKYYDLISLAYWKVILYELININVDSSPYLFKEKVRRIAMLQKNDDLNTVAKNVKLKQINSSFHRFIYRLYFTKSKYILTIVLDFVLRLR